MSRVRTSHRCKLDCGSGTRRAEAAYREYGSEVQRGGRAAAKLPKGARPDNHWAALRPLDVDPPRLRERALPSSHTDSRTACVLGTLAAMRGATMVLCHPVLIGCYPDFTDGWENSVVEKAQGFFQTVAGAAHPVPAFERDATPSAMRVVRIVIHRLLR